MPFSRRRYRRRSFRRRSSRMGGFRKRPLVRLSRQIRFINKRLSSEVKKFDTQVQDATLDIGGVMFNLSAVAQGDTVSNREGNQVRPKYINIVGNCAALTGPLRFILFQDTQMVVGTAPTVAAVVESASPISLLNKTSAGAGRFNIIADKMYTNYTTDNGVQQKFKLYKRLDRKPYIKTTWFGATNTDFQNGHFFLLALPTADETSSVDLNVRFAFYDN